MISTTHLKRFLAGLVFALATCQAPLHAATDAEAQAIVDEYNGVYQQWMAEMRLAKDPRTLDLVTKKRPDAGIYATKLKNLLRKDLANDWSLKYGAWLLENDAALKAESQRALLNAVEKHHVKSPEVGAFCIAMINLDAGGEVPRPGDVPLRSRGMKLLEMIKKTNPDEKVQGQAALALSIMLGDLGDDGGIMRQRMTNLKEAIIKSADVKVGPVTVADVARDELYKISHLTKGREAPNIVGLDSANRPMNLKDFRGKVVMLVFWSSWDLEAARVLETLRKSVESKAGKPFAVVGVNRDTLVNLRALEADRIVTWKNFSDPEQKIAKDYRLASWPYCLVLDKNGVIAYRGAPGSFADAVANNLLLPSAEPSAQKP
ncbi:hypothetical protein NT6N_36300 [Oceaniferula spumae]|uniref:Thioredoxin domain-containing protein n=1 Tax=Oceaniferula spumae TaxID=2979115 RepID=A0AAT9FRC5_9BACT